MDQVYHLLTIFFRVSRASLYYLLTFQCSLDASNNTFCFFIITEKLDEEKKEREHLLALNQVIAQQVLQKRRSLPGRFDFLIQVQGWYEVSKTGGAQ